MLTNHKANTHRFGSSFKVTYKFYLNYYDYRYKLPLLGPYFILTRRRMV